MGIKKKIASTVAKSIRKDHIGAARSMLSGREGTTALRKAFLSNPASRAAVKKGAAKYATSALGQATKLVGDKVSPVVSAAGMGWMAGKMIQDTMVENKYKKIKKQKKERAKLKKRAKALDSFKKRGK